MHNNKKSKNNSKEKLRMLLDNVSIEDLSSKDKEHLVSLAKRIEEQQKMESNTYKKIVETSSEEEIDPMKPKVTIHRRKKVEEIQPPAKRTTEPVIQTQEKPKDLEEIFEKKPETPEIKIEEIKEPLFIEVKPKENTKQEEEKTITDSQDSQNIKVDGLAEWEPIDVQEEITEEEPMQPKIEEKKPEEIKKPEISEPIKEKTLEEKDIIFCSECGTKAEGDDFCFCPICGNKLVADKKVDIEEEEKIPSFIPVKKMEEEQIEQPLEEPNENEQQSDEWKEIEAETLKKQEQSTDEAKVEEELDEWKETKDERKIEHTIDESEQKEDELPQEPVEEEKAETVDKKEEKSSWESIEEDIIQPTDKVINQKEKEVDFSFEEQKEIKVFKQIKCIDDKTAIMLNNYGFTSIDSLRYLSLKDLKKVNGINSKLAKQIKKEIKECDKEKFFDKNGFSEYIIKDDFEKDKEDLVEEKISERKKKRYFEEGKENSDEIDVFKDMMSIDEKNAELLYKNGITSIEILRETSITDLTKIRGIRRNLAKQIKKELETKPKRSIKIKRRKKEKEVDTADEEENLGEWEYIDEPSKKKDKKIDYYMHGDFTLYEKKLALKGNKKRTVRFFSKAEPDEGKPIKLPKGYEVKENKKTGVPYLRKKK